MLMNAVLLSSSVKLLPFLTSVLQVPLATVPSHCTWSGQGLSNLALDHTGDRPTYPPLPPSCPRPGSSFFHPRSDLPLGSTVRCLA